MDFNAILINLALLVVSLGIHEWAHAWAAFKFGDDTAARQGRLTLNPVPHIDPIGLLPILLGLPLGWAKPVPVNPLRVRNPALGLPLIAAAGPISNILQMVAGVAVCGIFLRFTYLMDPNTAGVIFEVLTHYIKINLWLALFNLFPVHPLDGSKIVSLFLPADMADRYENALYRSGYFPLIILFLANSFSNGAILGFWYKLWSPVFRPIFSLFSVPFH